MIHKEWVMIYRIKNALRSMGGWTYNYFDYYVEGFTTDLGNYLKMSDKNDSKFTNS